jgi:hypothetical protein
VLLEKVRGTKPPVWPLGVTAAPAVDTEFGLLASNDDTPCGTISFGVRTAFNALMTPRRDPSPEPPMGTLVGPAMKDMRPFVEVWLLQPDEALLPVAPAEPLVPVTAAETLGLIAAAETVETAAAVWAVDAVTSV